MLRRSHKKSRGGCLECKRRHVKCDEGRPACRLCTISERECSFASPAEVESASTYTRDSSVAFSHSERPRSPGDKLSEGSCATLPVDDVPSPLTFSSLPTTNSPGRLNVTTDNIVNSLHRAKNPTLDEALNLDHMELIIHLTLDRDTLSLGNGSVRTEAARIAAGLRLGLEWPYLLHQLLALSARHLAYLHPGRAPEYMYRAVALQTRAVSLFNTACRGVDRSNCVAVLVFSAVLGHHLFADMLAGRDDNNHHSGGDDSGRGGSAALEAFTARYMQCVDMYRGIYTIACTAWPLLMESELAPILAWSSGFTSRKPRGAQCRRALELIDKVGGLNEADREACRLAIHYLQVGFDAVLAEEAEEDDDDEGNRYQMIFLWTMLVPPEFTALMAAKRPEGLVVLAYYAWLLYYGRHMWQVKCAGAYVLGIVGDYLGSEWDHWLEHPREVVK